MSDKLTGTNADRPQLKKLMAALAPGDLVIIPVLDCMARDPTDLLVLTREMDRAGAALRSLAEPVVDTSGDFKEVVLALLGVSAKLEHRRLMDRTTRGRHAAKARGVRFGRKPKLTLHQQRETRQRLAKGEESTRAIALSMASATRPSAVCGPPGGRRMSLVQLRRVDPAKNMKRFYVLDVAQDLFGGWWLVREHGRIGSPGRVIRTAFDTLDRAAAAHARLWREKVRKGYSITEES